MVCAFKASEPKPRPTCILRIHRVAHLGNHYRDIIRFPIVFGAHRTEVMSGILNLSKVHGWGGPRPWRESIVLLVNITHLSDCHIYVYIHISEYMHTHMYTYSTHTHIYIYTYTCTYAHTCTYTWKHIHTLISTHAHNANTHTYTCTCTHMPYTHAHAHTCLILMHTCLHTYASINY